MLHLTFYHGGTCVVLPKFDLPTALNAVQKYKCTSALVVPPIALALAKHPIVDQYDLTSLRYILCGAAPLSAELQEALAARLKGRTYVVQGLGMTETTSVGVIPYLEGAKPGYVGKLISTMEARLVDVDGKDVKRGEAGELVSPSEFSFSLLPGLHTEMPSARVPVAARTERYARVPQDRDQGPDSGRLAHDRYVDPRVETSAASLKPRLTTLPILCARRHLRA